MTSEEFAERCADIVGENCERLRNALACAADDCAQLAQQWQEKGNEALAANARRERVRYLELERQLSQLEHEAAI